MSVTIYNFTEDKLYPISYYSKTKPCEDLISLLISHGLIWEVSEFRRTPQWCQFSQEDLNFQVIQPQ